MTRILALVLLPALSSGCILYDGTCDGGPKGECRLDDDGDGLTEDTAGLGQDSADAAATFTLDPDQAEAGETVIVSLTAENFDLATVTEVEVFGDVTLLAGAAREGEILLTLGVDADADEGAADVLLHVGDEVEFLEAAFTVHAAGTDDGSGGSGDTGDDCD
ncbi:MAG: hypothetical protein EXR71_10895 [Myxococcales bacterium]|nr:hypothetical protein [Myxococcales bacterium]